MSRPGDGLSDKDLGRVRLRFLDLVKSFFLNEPDAESLSRWRGILSAMAGTRVTPRLDRAIAALNLMLTRKKLEEIRDEYYALFIDPYSEYRIPTTASFHLDGRNFGPSLVRYRAFLMEAGIVKKHEVPENEDALTVMLDTMATLVEAELQGDVDSRRYQEELLASFLAPASGLFADHLQHSDRADFYRECADFLMGYLDIEKGLLGTVDGRGRI